MSFITNTVAQPDIVTEGRTEEITVGGAGLKVISPDGKRGPAHFVTEPPWAPIAIGLIDLSITTEQVVEVIAQGRYIADKVTVLGADGAPGSATVTIKTLDSARGGGRTLANALSLSGLSDRKAIAEVDLDLGVWMEAPYLYCTVASAGTGTARVLLYGRLVATEDPHGRTYETRDI